MKRYFPLLVAIILATGLALYVLAGKSSAVSTTPSAPATDESSFAGSTPAPKISASKLVDGTHTGKVVSTDYGDIQVAIVVMGGKVTEVDVLKQPGSKRRSIEINANAFALLKAEVLTAQASIVNAISGASFTSEGFMKTLSSAFSS